VNIDLSNPKINAKKWWSISKNLCAKKNNPRIPTIVENGLSINNPKEKACIFNSYFVAQTQLLVVNVDASFELPVFQSAEFLANIYVDENEVLTLMRNVDISKACGFDGIGNRIIKLCSEGIH
jgi:hypothetical protein